MIRVSLIILMLTGMPIATHYVDFLIMQVLVRMLIIVGAMFTIYQSLEF